LFQACFYKYWDSRIKFQEVAEALQCYRYIPPPERRIHQSILDRQRCIKNSADALVLWETVANIDTWLDLEEQEALLEYLP
jgi:hypothetical protein